MDPPIVQPPQGGCAIANADRKTCDCGVRLNIGNGCQADLVASDFSFLTCETDAGVEKNCTTVRRGELGWLVKELHEVGPVEWTFNLEGERGAESVTVRANVEEFVDSGCGCELPGAGDVTPNGAALVLGSGLLAWVVARRNRWRSLS
jgi:hypothetical protein